MVSTKLSNPVSGIAWRRSTHSGNVNCVEVAVAPAWRTGVAVRDSKNPDGDLIVATARAWGAFTRGVRCGLYEIRSTSADEAQRRAIGDGSRGAVASGLSRYRAVAEMTGEGTSSGAAQSTATGPMGVTSASHAY